MKTINEVVHVAIDPDGDGLDGLYIDGKLVAGGDYYHDKASERIESFVDALKFMGWDGTVVRYDWVDVAEEQCWELPELLSDLPLDKMETSK